jgi:hypothetical protein
MSSTQSILELNRDTHEAEQELLQMSDAYFIKPIFFRGRVDRDKMNFTAGRTIFEHRGT